MQQLVCWVSCAAAAVDDITEAALSPSFDLQSKSSALCLLLLIMIGKQAVRDTVKGKRADVLPLITTLKKLVNHPRLVYEVAAY